MIKTLHLTILACTAIVVLLADKQGFAWMSGVARTLDGTLVRRLHYFMWAGLLGMIVTGLIQLLPAYRYYLSEPFFVVKLCFVAALAFNGILIGRLQHIATERPYVSLSTQEKIPLFISGAVSTAGWVIVALIGFYLI